MDVRCTATPCPVILSAVCVFYEGPNLIYTGINTNDNLQVVIEKLNDYIVAGGGSAGTSGTSGRNGTSGTRGTSGTSGTSGESGDKYSTTSSLEEASWSPFTISLFLL